MGDINVIELVLLAIATFIFAIDQFSLTEVLYRPMVACPIMGAILGDINTGLVVGGTYELMMVGNMPIGGAQPPNAVLGGVVAMIFAVKADMDVNAALGACMIFATFGQYIVTLVFSVASGLMAKADKAAAEANPKGITNVLNIHMLMLGSLFAVIAIVAYVGYCCKRYFELFKRKCKLVHGWSKCCWWYDAFRWIRNPIEDNVS